MNINGKKLLTSAALAVSLGSIGVGVAQAADPVVAGADLLIARPLGVAATAAGTGIFIGTLPITYVAGAHEEAAKELVEAPARFTFQRPLGEESY